MPGVLWIPAALALALVVLPVIGLLTRTVCSKSPVCGLKCMAVMIVRVGWPWTVTFTGAEVAAFPQPSVATATSV